MWERVIGRPPISASIFDQFRNADGGGNSYGLLNASTPVDNSTATRDRNNSLSPDQRYDTTEYADYTGNYTWQIALANGTYRVHLVAGDATKTNVTYTVKANGLTFLSGTVASGSTHPWIEATGNVTVSNGLFLLTGASGNANELAYIDIWPSGDVSSAPAEPTGLTVTSESTTSADIRWTDNSDNETGFQIQRSTNNSTWTTITTTNSSGTTTPAPTFPNAQYFGDTGLTANTTYYYRVCAVNANASPTLYSSYTSSVSVTTPATNAEAPYGGTTWSTDNLIQAENFDVGGEGVELDEYRARINELFGKDLWKMRVERRPYDGERHLRDQLKHGSWVIALLPQLVLQSK
jgi:hypothetical protein